MSFVLHFVLGLAKTIASLTGLQAKRGLVMGTFFMDCLKHINWLHKGAT